MTTNRTSSRIRRRTRTALAAATLLIVAAAAAGCAGAGRGADSGLSRPEVEAVVRTELAGVAAPSSAPAAMTRTEIEQAIEEAVEGAADEAIEQAVDAAIDDAAGMTRTEIEHAADAAVEQAVDAAIDDAAGMTRTEIEHAIEEAVAAALAAQSPPEPGVTEAELAGAIRNALADAVPQEPAVTRADVEAISRRVVASVPPRSDPAAYTRFVVDNAISRYDSDGLDAVAAHYSRPESVDGQWYVFIVDDNDTVVGHYNPNLLGLDLNGPVGTDANGYNYGAEMLTAADDGKWVSYVYTNPAAGGVGSERFGASQLKNAWVVRHDGLLFGSGWYIDADEFTKSLVATAVDRFRATGLEATVAYFAGGDSVLAGLEQTIDYYNNADSVAGEWFAFIADPSGTIVAHYDPELLGKHLEDLFGAGTLTATEDGNWVTTHDTGAASGEPTSRLHAWVMEHDGFVFGSGWQYDRPD